MHSITHPLQPLLSKVRRIARLSEADERALLAVPHRVGRIDANRYIIREGDVPRECCLLVEGYAARSKLATDGGRQIVSFHIAGDILDLQHLFLERADHSVQSMTDAKLVWLPMVALRDLASEHPAIGTAFWRDALVDASIFREWVLNVGRRDAKTRVAHMLCEFIVRSEAAGLGTVESMRLPFTQEQIGDATGLTAVHVNRMLRELTDEGLIERTPGVLRVLDWPGFKRAATFNAAYLHAAA
ncbi:cAMP-binding domain of CRP or a regulatory subunit of cAMP-dependent protein kinases [Sphingomonas sp. NFR04]|uniref:Crp/Fnr family transcriptional regulator n=1 Tax=Sphingomonas sp. NFR04 TaxID=1566283 RepID=UPI0008E2D284|nr:Crp/Fnr family transcriptional regulator [Sphingomonas sp. NFR04]SFK28232.1 cAMP-binding domain of CRP or a regulatory subunit of cAMP-dependent protein kinases [Sphingomonas sp. NFR04]